MDDMTMAAHDEAEGLTYGPTETIEEASPAAQGAAFLALLAAREGIPIDVEEWTSTHLTVDVEGIVALVERLMAKAADLGAKYPAAALTVIRESP